MKTTLLDIIGNIYLYRYLFLQDADFSPGPFILSSVRTEAADHTIQFHTGQARILSGIGGQKINPWSFLLPLKSLVWASTVIALLVVLVVLHLLPCCMSSIKEGSGQPASNAFSCVRVILQQGEVSGIVLSPLWLHDDLEGFRALTEYSSTALSRLNSAS